MEEEIALKILYNLPFLNLSSLSEDNLRLSSTLPKNLDASIGVIVKDTNRENNDATAIVRTNYMKN